MFFATLPDCQCLENLISLFMDKVENVRKFTLQLHDDANII